MEPRGCCIVNCELFGKRGAFFDSAIAPLWTKVYESLVSRARVAKGSRALDVGTGSGEVALRLAVSVGDDGRVVGIDEQGEMLQIAASKARHRGLSNIQFRQMSMERMDVSGNSFDSILANYSLCCCMDYRSALAECLRVLKPGGRLTYNHGGPSDPLANQLITRIFEKYKTKSPSKKLRQFREVKDAQVESFTRFRNPFTTVELLRSLGYEGVEATLTRHSLVYSGPGGFVDEWLSFDPESAGEPRSSNIAPLAGER